MNILYVFAHPNTDSFSQRLMREGVQYINSKHVPLQISDLYQQGFKATGDWDDFNVEIRASQYFNAQKEALEQNALAAEIIQEIEKITWAEHIIFHFPLWWFSAPAILKGWFDRALVKGFAYDTGKVFTHGLLTGKTASLTTSTQSPQSAYQIDGDHKNDLEAFLLPIHHTLRFAGIKPLPPFVVYSAFQLEKEAQNAIFSRYQNYLQTLFKNSLNDQ